MLWPTPRNFVRSLRCSFDVLMWGQKQTLRLLAPWLAPLTSIASARRDSSVGLAVEPTVDYAQEVAAVSAEIEADIQADMEAAIDAGLVADVDAVEAELDVAVDAEMAAAAVTPADLVRPDDLTVIDGIGPKLAERLNAAGVATFAALAAWQPGDIERFEATLPPVQRGRLEREDWIGQASGLASAAG